MAVRSDGVCTAYGRQDVKDFDAASYIDFISADAKKEALLEIASPSNDAAAWYYAAAIANDLNVKVDVEPLLLKIDQVSSDDFSMQTAGMQVYNLCSAFACCRTFILEARGLVADMSVATIPSILMSPCCTHWKGTCSVLLHS